jgi:cobalamin synthase
MRMKKLTLQIDDLAVETFQTAVPVREEGTVVAHKTQGNNYTCDPLVGTCFGYTCAGAGC